MLFPARLARKQGLAPPRRHTIVGDGRDGVERVEEFVLELWCVVRAFFQRPVKVGEAAPGLVVVFPRSTGAGSVARVRVRVHVGGSRGRFATKTFQFM